MRHLLTYIAFFCCVGLSAQNTGQLYNEGKLYVDGETVMTAESDFINAQTGRYINNGIVLFKEDYHNEGTATFTEDGGLTRFEGQGFQKISGNMASEFYDVRFKNYSAQPAFGLSNDVLIYGQVNFKQGIVDNKQYGGMIIFQEGAGHFNTSDASYAEGFVDKIGGENFTYPIGEKGYYRPAGTVMQLGNGEPHFAAKYHLSNSDILYSHELKTELIQYIDHLEYWTVLNMGASGDRVFVTLSWDPATTPQYIIDAAYEGSLSIVRWDEEKQMWMDEGGTIDISTKTVTTEINDFGVFTFGILNSKKVEPCHLTVYNAVTPNKDGINDYFRIDQSNNTCGERVHVQIFNRWGVKVFETQNYSKANEVFKGFSNGRATVKEGKRLPTGTYFYVLDYKYNAGGGTIKTHQQTGYLYVSGN